MVTILYRPNSEHSTEVDNFLQELKRNRIAAKVVDVDSKEGAALVELYDLTRYPAVLAAADDGTPLQSWKGQLPLISEIGYYAHA